MIKVELLEEEDKKLLFFETNNPNNKEEIDTLDKILGLLVPVYPRRGGYMVGSPGVLKIEVNTKE